MILKGNVIFYVRYIILYCENENYFYIYLLILKKNTYTLKTLINIMNKTYQMEQNIVVCDKMINVS